MPRSSSRASSRSSSSCRGCTTSYRVSSSRVRPLLLLLLSSLTSSSLTSRTSTSSRAVITQCCMQALYNLGDEAQDVIDVAKGFERRMCNHLKARPEDECLTAMAGASLLPSSPSPSGPHELTSCAPHRLGQPQPLRLCDPVARAPTSAAQGARLAHHLHRPERAPPRGALGPDARQEAPGASRSPRPERTSQDGCCLGSLAV